MVIFLIIVIAAIFRFYGLNWDSGFHLHPDERMITMVAEKITLEDLNPHFFAYGSFPLYLLKAAGTVMGQFSSEFAVYTSLNLVGRFLSAFFDLGTLAILYLLAKKVFGQKIAILASFFYAVSVLPIQLSHFYAVDTPLTFFTMLTLFLLIRYLEKPKLNWILLIGASFGLALATKTSAVLLIIPIAIALASQAMASQAIASRTIKKMAVGCSLLAVSVIAVFFIFEPYALLDFQEFWRQTIAQQEMTKSAFTFPYTLQYVGKTPYLYELKNIFFWGLGPILAGFTFIGTILVTVRTLTKIKLASQGEALQGYSIILLSFFWTYFLVTGSFAIGFMRYMLPLYPLLCLFAAFFIGHLKLPKLLKILKFPLLISLLLWPLAFMQIYTQPNTRLQATDWILQNIPAGKTLAIEHWDDGLPLLGAQNYRILTLPLYDPDTPQKWNIVNQILSQTDYIITASNRLYTPLQKLTDCPNLPPGRCYAQTAGYYQALFDGSLGFSKIAEFTSSPHLELGTWNLELRDEGADESFNVYDHPKVMIFKKVL